MPEINIEKYLKLTEKTFVKKLGKVVKIVGLTIESVGPDANLNDVCKIISKEEYQQIDTIITNKYNPTLGTLFANIDLK